MKFVEETAHFWKVECAAKGCHVMIAVPKRVRDSNGKKVLAKKPKNRRCSSHPPGSVAK